MFWSEEVLVSSENYCRAIDAGRNVKEIAIKHLTAMVELAFKVIPESIQDSESVAEKKNTNASRKSQNDVF